MTVPAPLSLARLYGRDAQGVAGRALGRVHGVTLLVHPGVHAFLGTPADGTAALCEMLCGRRRPRAGAVLLHGREPWRSPRARAHIGALLGQPDLPPVRKVEQVIAMHGLTVAALHDFGAGALAGRTLRSLELAEARAVELSLALALADPQALVLYEPFTECGPIDRALVRARLAARAAAGVCVVLAVSARSDVEGLAEIVHVLDAGRLVSSTRGWGADRRELCIWLTERSAARRFAAALGERPELSAVRLRQLAEGPTLVAVEGADLAAASLAVAEVVAAQGVAVSAMRTAPAAIVDAPPKGVGS